MTAFDQMAGETLEAFGDISKWRNVSRLLQLPKFEIAAKLNLKPVSNFTKTNQQLNSEQNIKRKVFLIRNQRKPRTVLE